METAEVEIIEASSPNQRINSDREAITVTTAPEPSTSYRISTNKRSPIYEYFDFNEVKGKWKCKHCLTQLAKAKDKGTGSLVNHLKHAHPRKHKEFRNKSDQGLLRHVIITPTDQQEDDDEKVQQYSSEEFKSILTEFIVASDQPFSLVSEEGFKKLIQYVSKGDKLFALPTRQHIPAIIHQKYTKEKNGLKLALESISSKISFSIDGWTSKNQFPFQGVTAHWIDDDWKLRTAVIDLSLLEGSHTGENLASSFSEVLEDYGLWNKILSLTTDNASNMTKLFTYLEDHAAEKGVTFDTKNQRVRCMAHIINLACQAALKQLDKEYTTIEENDIEEDERDLEHAEGLSTIKKLRLGVKYIRNSPPMRQTFRQQCYVANIEGKMLTLDVKTRWNSTLDMLETAEKLRVPFELTLQTISKTKKLILLDEEWTRIEKMIELLLPFRETTKLMSHESIPMLGDTVTYYDALFHYLEKYIKEPSTSYRIRHNQQPPHPEWLMDAADASWKKLTEYYPTSDGLVYQVATVLDPRYKHQWYGSAGWNSSWITDCKRAVRNCWTGKYKPRVLQADGTSNQLEHDTPPPEKRSKLTSIEIRIQEQLSSIQTPNLQDELSKYLAEGLVPPSTLVKSLDGKSGIDGVLGWWKMREPHFPNLAKMARDYLAVSATGVPVERLFSSSTDLLSQRRQSLQPQTIRECVCLKYWIRKRDKSSILSSIQLKAYNEIE